MKIEVGDKVRIKRNIEFSCPIEQKYIGKIGTIVEVNNDRPSPISVQIPDIGTDSYWAEELEKQ